MNYVNKKIYQDQFVHHDNRTLTPGATSAAQTSLSVTFNSNLILKKVSLSVLVRNTATGLFRGNYAGTSLDISSLSTYMGDAIPNFTLPSGNPVITAIGGPNLRAEIEGDIFISAGTSIFFIYTAYDNFSATDIVYYYCNYYWKYQEKE